MTYVQTILNKLRKRLPTLSLALTAPSLLGSAGVGLWLCVWLFLLTACTDVLQDQGEVADAQQGTGEMVMFTVGTTENNVSRAGEAKTYYMPDASRFICRMYYKAQTGSADFDVTGGSDQTAWLKVNGNVGDSKYWNWKYLPVVESVSGQGGVDKYGNDFSAPAFYWQNREEHAFLAWTDLNRVTNISGGNNQGDLKFAEDEIYTVHTKTITSQWVVTGYQIHGVDDIFNSQKAMEAYVQKADGSTTKGETGEFKALQEACPVHSKDWSASTFYYRHGLQHKWSEAYADTTYLDADTPAEATQKEYKWVKYLMFFDKIEYTGATEGAGIHSEKDDDDVVIFLMDGTGKYLAAAEVIKDGEGHFLDINGEVTEDPEEYTYNYYQTDESGNIRYDETRPLYTFYYRVLYEKKDVETVEEYPALAFDLTRKSPDDETMTMASQPDIVQALERQAPTGATQESNRVNLYFKHQFSQIQVNVKNAADNSVSLDASDIKKVELLGVSKKGYVFTQINKTGTIIRPTTYEDIDFSQYTEADLIENPFGTAFKMFVLPEIGRAHV